MDRTTVTLERERMQREAGQGFSRYRSTQAEDYAAFYADTPEPPPCEHKWVVNLGQTREYCIKCLVGKVEFESEAGR